MGKVKSKKSSLSGGKTGRHSNAKLYTPGKTPAKTSWTPASSKSPLGSINRKSRAIKRKQRLRLGTGLNTPKTNKVASISPCQDEEISNTILFQDENSLSLSTSLANTIITVPSDDEEIVCLDISSDSENITKNIDSPVNSSTNIDNSNTLGIKSDGSLAIKLKKDEKDNISSEYIVLDETTPSKKPSKRKRKFQAMSPKHKLIKSQITSNVLKETLLNCWKAGKGKKLAKGSADTAVLPKGKKADKSTYKQKLRLQNTAKQEKKRAKIAKKNISSSQGSASSGPSNSVQEARYREELVIRPPIGLGEDLGRRQQEQWRPLPYSNSFDPKFAFMLQQEPQAKLPLRIIIIDGQNVAHGHLLPNTRFSARGIDLCVNYFEQRGHKVIVFLPGSCQRYKQMGILNRLQNRGVLIYTPSRVVDGRIIQSYDDRFIIEYASQVSGIVVSRDQFRDLIHENPQFYDTISNRLLQYTFVGDLLMFPNDPLGKHGPPLDVFLRFHPGEPCPIAQINPPLIGNVHPLTSLNGPVVHFEHQKVCSNFSKASKNLFKTSVEPPLVDIDPPLEPTHPSKASARNSKIFVNPPLVDVDAPKVSIDPPLVDIDPPLASIDPPLVVIDPPLASVDSPLVDIDPPKVSTNQPVVEIDPPSKHSDNSRGFINQSKESPPVISPDDLGSQSNLHLQSPGTEEIILM